MSNILETIVKRKKEKVLERQKTRSESLFIDSPHFNKPKFSMSAAIKSGSGIIAEFKRKSPSKPAINASAISSEIVPAYANAGASAVSILTDVDFFGGNDFDLYTVRPLVDIPILRKDFVIDRYQIMEAKAMGADVILLIAEILSKEEVKELSRLATEIGLEVLLEVHTSDQLAKYDECIRNVGVNNRDLKSFTTNVKYSLDIFPQLPQDAVKVSESGIDHPQTVLMLKESGYDGFLIGENFMKTENPGEACKEFINQMRLAL